MERASFLLSHIHCSKRKTAERAPSSRKDLCSSLLWTVTHIVGQGVNFFCFSALQLAMLRRAAARTSVSALAVPAVATSQRRELFFDAPIVYNTGLHFSSLLGVPASMSALVSSPIGTIALIGLTFNVAVVGVKHLQYTLELFLKDYYQDVVLLHALRYLIFITLIISTAHLFVEL